MLTGTARPRALESGLSFIWACAQLHVVSRPLRCARAPPLPALSLEQESSFTDRCYFQRGAARGCTDSHHRTRRGITIAAGSTIAMDIFTDAARDAVTKERDVESAGASNAARATGRSSFILTLITEIRNRAAGLRTRSER